MDVCICIIIILGRKKDRYLSFFGVTPLLIKDKQITLNKLKMKANEE